MRMYLLIADDLLLNYLSARSTICKNLLEAFLKEAIVFREGSAAKKENVNYCILHQKLQSPCKKLHPSCFFNALMLIKKIFLKTL